MPSFQDRLVLFTLVLGWWTSACGGRSDRTDDTGMVESEPTSGDDDVLSSGGQSNSGGTTNASGGGAAESGGTSAGGVGSGESGGEGGALTHPDIPPDEVGHSARSCGGNMWSKDETIFLDCTVGGEHETHPECNIVDCTAHGDEDSICVYSNHCYCTEGFTCEFTDTQSAECPSRATCVPIE